MSSIQYFKIANTRYNETDFQALDNVTDNVIGEEIELDDDYVVKVGTVLATCGLKNDLALILRDYNGKLRDEPINLGYIAINFKDETPVVPDEEESTTPSSDVTPEKESKKETENTEKEVKEESKIENPQTIDNIAIYGILLIMGLFGTLIAIPTIKKRGL